MQRLFMVLCAVAVLGSYGCSREVRNDAAEIGNDMKRDVQKAGRNVGDAVEDATD